MCFFSSNDTRKSDENKDHQMIEILNLIEFNHFDDYVFSLSDDISFADQKRFDVFYESFR